MGIDYIGITHMGNSVDMGISVVYRQDYSKNKLVDTVLWE